MVKGLLGEKLGHSYSKFIHELMTDYTYDLIEVKREDLDSFMKAKQFDALNVTIPYKQTVMPYLDEIEPTALELGAVNTIVNRGGKLYGYNTDAYGFEYMLKNHQIDVKDKKVAILGNGGAAKAIDYVLRKLGAKEIIKVKKNPSNETIFYEDFYENHKDTQVLVNCSPVGMFPNNDQCPVDLDQCPNLEAVVDVVYNPLNTKLIIEAKHRNIQAIGGIEMLVAQAKQAIEHFLDISLEEDVIEDITGKVVQEMMNIVLIGMPGCGKSTFAGVLEEMLQHNSIDSDVEILKRLNGRTIAEFFREQGEPEFRRIETEVIKEISKKSSWIIATGGGVIKSQENMDALKQNGCIVFIDRDVNNMVIDDTRPLSPSREALEKLYNERIGLYRKYADYIVDNNGPIVDAANDIILKERQWRG